MARALRDAALVLSRALSKDDIVLVTWPGVPKSYLYVKYWSGIDSFEAKQKSAQPWLHGG